MRTENLRKSITLLGAMLVFLSIAAVPRAAASHSGVSVDISFFYGELAPYGRWVSVPTYGYVWCPRVVGSYWRPYTLGHWENTYEGWLWVSDEPFGWVAYHYGRWRPDPTYGWIWVPGYEWAPAWVSWRSGGGYIGWAPLPPQASFSFSFGLRSGPAYIDTYISPGSYCFVESRHFAGSRVAGYMVSPSRNTSIIRATTNVTRYSVSQNRVVNRGIDVDVVERATGRKLERRKIVDVSAKDGQRGMRLESKEVRVFRPAVRSSGKRPAPPASMIEQGRSTGSSKSKENLVSKPPAAVSKKPVVSQTPRPTGSEKHSTTKSSTVQKYVPQKSSAVSRSSSAQSKQEHVTTKTSVSQKPSIQKSVTASRSTTSSSKSTVRYSPASSSTLHKHSSPSKPSSTVKRVEPSKSVRQPVIQHQSSVQKKSSSVAHSTSQATKSASSAKTSKSKATTKQKDKQQSSGGGGKSRH